MSNQQSGSIELSQIDRLRAMSTVLLPNGLGFIFYVIEKDRFRIIPISDEYDEIFKRDNPLVDIRNCNIFGFTSYIQFLMTVNPLKGVT